MDFESTHLGTGSATLPEALFAGLAPDGGLYMPRRLPSFREPDLQRLRDRSWQEVAATVAGALFHGSIPARVCESIVADALNFPLPLVPLTDRIQVLELFRGPTLAFKDVGARFMARLMAHYRAEIGQPLTILTATSGDTGGAVANAFAGLPSTRVVILFPDGKVTPRQERQFSTLGGNVQAVAVQGDFDDCQRLAKEAFRSPRLREEVALTSANSINVGRLLPQSFYYIFARTRFDDTDPVLFSVPSGNFGNLTAGLIAKRMGLPRTRFLAATNANDGVGEYLRTGVFHARPSKRTLSTAMDVGDPSNLARIVHLYGGDLPSLREDLADRTVSDEETLATIRSIGRDTGYVLDPHSAVGFRALEKELDARPDTVGVLLATAHPAKFAEVVEPVIGRTLPVPPELEECLNGVRSVFPMEPGIDHLTHFLLNEGPRS